MTLICVIMGAPTRDSRNEAAKAALDFGFANYSLYTSPPLEINGYPVLHGCASECDLRSGQFTALIPKSAGDGIVSETVLPEELSAPLSVEKSVGTVRYYLDGDVIGESGIYPVKDCEEITFSSLFSALLKSFLMI